MQLENWCATYFKINPPLRSFEPGEEEVATENLNLGEPLELVPEVTYFLQGSAKSLREENVMTPSPKPPIEELQKWVTWKAQMHKTSSWWQELTMVPGVDDHKKLACKVWVYF